MIQASKVNLWDAQNTDWKKEVSMGQGKISPKQKEILEYIKSQILERGFPPAVRDICEAVHLKSTSSVHSHLETLEKNGNNFYKS